MLNACATALTDRLLSKFPTAQAHRAVYIYGFELSLSSLAVMGSVFILSCLCGAVNTSIRLFSGGYHAKTYGHCFILSNGVYLACLGTAHMIETLGVTFVCPVMILLSMVVVFALAPIKNNNHLISDASYQKNRNIALIFTTCEGLYLLVAYFFSFMLQIVCMGSTTMTAVAVLMVIPKIKERRKDA